jgi:hypothetical protein
MDRRGVLAARRWASFLARLFPGPVSFLRTSFTFLGASFTFLGAAPFGAATPAKRSCLVPAIMYALCDCGTVEMNGVF